MIRLAQWMKARRLSDDSGISLAELVITMMLGVLVLTMLSGLFLSTSRTVASTRSSHESTVAASNVINELNKVVRFGTPNPRAGVSEPDAAFISAGRESLIMYSDVDVDASVKPAGSYPRPQIVSFEIRASDRQLIETRWTATASGEFWTFPSYPATASATRNLGGVFAAAGTTPLFTYRDAAGNPVAAPATGSMSAALMKTVASVVVTATMRTANNPNAPFVTVVNTITIPNLGVAGVVS